MINSSLKICMLEQAFYHIYKAIYEIYHPHSVDSFDKTKRQRIEAALASTSIGITPNLLIRMEHTLENISIMLNNSHKLMPQEVDTLNKLQHTLAIQYKNFGENIDETEREIAYTLNRLSELKHFDASAVSAISSLTNHYSRIMTLYEDFLYTEADIAKISIKDWQNTLTRPIDYSFGKPFYFVAHATRNKAEEVYAYSYSRHLISTSLLSKLHTHTYKDSEYGLIYSPCHENLFLISKVDAYCDDVIDCRFNIGNEYVCKGSEVHSVLSTDPNACRTYKIEQLEKDHPKEYNEIVLLNNEHSRPTAIFRFDSCSQEHQNQAEKLSELMHLAPPLVLPKITD